MEIYDELEKLINDRYVEKIAGKYYKYVPDDRKGLITQEDLVSAGYAEIVVTDHETARADCAEIIREYDFERMRALMK